MHHVRLNIYMTKKDIFLIIPSEMAFMLSKALAADVNGLKAISLQIWLWAGIDQIVDVSDN